jgi:hypothetical protein
LRAHTRAGITGALVETGDICAWHEFFQQLVPKPRKICLTLADNTFMRGFSLSLPVSEETSMPGEHEQEALRAQVNELKFALQWERTQKDQLLEEQSRFRREIKRLQDRVADLELQLTEKSHDPAHT